MSPFAVDVFGIAIRKQSGNYLPPRPEQIMRLHGARFWCSTL